MDTPRALTLPSLAALLLLGAAPLLILLVGVALPGDPVGPDAVPFRLGEVLPLLAYSLVLAAVSATIATALGLVPGVALGRSDLPGKPAWAILLVLPALLPPVIVAAGWQPWTDAWLDLAGDSGAARLAGACAVLALVTFPIPLFLTALSVRRTDRALEDVARLSGGRARAVRSLVLRLARPGVSLGWLLVFLLALSESPIPRLLGVPTYAARLEELAGGGGWRDAGFAALPLLLLAVAVAAAESRLFGERGVAFLGRALDLEPTRLPLGRFRRSVVVALGALAAVAVLGPLAGWALETHAGGRGAARLAWAWSAGLPAFARSLVVALGAGSLAVAVGLPLAYASERGRLRARAWVDLLLVVLFAVPGAVLALGLLQLVPLDAFRASGAALVAALGVQLAVVPYRMERVGLRQLGASAEEAGTLAGAGWQARVRDLVLPLNAELLAGTWAAALLLAFRDAGLAVSLSPRLPVFAALGADAAARDAGTAGALGLVAAGGAAFTLVIGAALARLLGRDRVTASPPAEPAPAGGGMRR